MRPLLILLTLALSTAAIAGPSSTKPKKTDPSEEAGQRFIRKLTSVVSKAGYKNIELAPHIFILFATNKNGEKVTLVVDTEQMRALELRDRPNASEVAAEEQSETYLPGLH
jgi:hypothetical protein